MNYKKIKNQIGYIENKYLGIPRPGGHYVYIREVNNNGMCDVNVVTSLEDRDKKINRKKIKQVRVGNTYALPYFDTNFSRWSGVNKKPIKNVRYF